MMLIIVDSHSKWNDVNVTTSINASMTIEKLMFSFAIHGLPHTIVSDNGPSFVSSEFELFNKMNGIRHIKISLHHPASSSNGPAEHTVQTVKYGISKMEGGNLQSKVTRLLSHYSADNYGNLTFSTPYEETDPIPTGFVRSYTKFNYNNYNN